jgi:hypothetical protein
VRKSSCTLFEIMQVQWGLWEQQNICLWEQQNICLWEQQNICLWEKQNICLWEKQNTCLWEQQNICLRKYVNLAISKYSAVWPPNQPNQHFVWSMIVTRYRPNSSAYVVKLLKRTLLRYWPNYGSEYVTETSHGFPHVLHEVDSVFPHNMPRSPASNSFTDDTTTRWICNITKETENNWRIIWASPPAVWPWEKIVMWNYKNISKCEDYWLCVQWFMCISALKTKR